MTDKPEKLEEYTVDINGQEHTLLLSAEDAERYGDAATKAGSKAKAPANKARSAEDK